MAVLTAGAAGDSDVMVYFFDVGQGDSILITVDGKNMLIDGGPAAAGSALLGYLGSANITHLDFVVATHAHEDHIGGLIAVLESTIIVDTVLYNGYNYTSQTKQKFLTSAENHSSLTLAERNDVYILSAAANFTVLSPTQPHEFANTDLNANSVVLKLQVSNVSFLFTGDATAAAEQSMLNAGLNVSSNVLKVAHHGSRTSTSQAFLDAVNPAYAVISAGVDNIFGHPHEETVQRLIGKGVVTYGTYVSGTIVFITDGNTVTVQDDPEPIPEFPSALTLPLMAATLLISIAYKRKHSKNDEKDALSFQQGL